MNAPPFAPQAVYRAYRYGQSRPVFVYRLISEGLEQCMYRQQVVKLQLAGRVLDEQDPRVDPRQTVHR